MDKLEDRIKALPADLRREVEDFLAFLVDKYLKGTSNDSQRLIQWKREQDFIQKRLLQASAPGKRAWKREELYE